MWRGSGQERARGAGQLRPGWLASWVLGVLEAGWEGLGFSRLWGWPISHGQRYGRIVTSLRRQDLLQSPESAASPETGKEASPQIPFSAASPGPAQGAAQSWLSATSDRRGPVG